MSKISITVDSSVLRAYSVDEVAERLSVSTKTVRRMIDENELKTLTPRRSGRTIRITEQSLRDLFAAAEAGA